MNTIFSIEQANKILPLIKSITVDIVSLWEQISKARIEMETNFTAKNKEIPSSYKEDVHYFIDKISYCIKEVEALGCFVDEFKRGIINFPSLYHGRKVFLCWQLGEVKVENWHEIDESFDDKQSVTDDIYKGELNYSKKTFKI